MGFRRTGREYGPGFLRPWTRRCQHRRGVRGGPCGRDLARGRRSHVATAHDGAGTVKMFFDGSLVPHNPARFTPASVVPAFDLVLGTSGDCGTGFPGVLDDVRIYRRALGVLG